MMRRFGVRGLLFLGIGCVGVGLAAPVWAQAATNSAGVTQARNLGRDALAALDAKRFPEAEELFTRALAHHEAPTLRLGRARARVGMGHWVEALVDYDAVLAASGAEAGAGASSAAASSAFVKAQREASLERTALQARVPQLTLVFQGAVSPRVDGVLWTSASEQGAALNPGTHRISAETGKKTFERSLELKESSRERVLIPVPETVPVVAKTGEASEPVPAPGRGAVAAGTSAPKPAVASTSTALAEPAAESSGGGWGRWIGVGATGLLVVGAVVTGVFALQERSSFKSINSDPSYSAGYKSSQRDEALKWAWINTAFTAGAVVAGGVTGYLWLTSDPEPSNGAFAPPNGVGFTFRGAF
jgi:hypothetical protein